MRGLAIAAAMLVAGGAEAATYRYTYTGNTLVLDESTCQMGCPAPTQSGIGILFTLDPDLYEVGDILSLGFYGSARDTFAGITVTGTTGSVSAFYEG